MNRLMGWALAAMLLLGTATADAGRYADTIELFKNAGASAQFFKDSYAYAVFPSIGQGALVVGGAHGKGHVYVQDKYVGNTTMTQVSVGFQAGGRAYSMIIFLQDKRAFDEFTGGNYEFGADVNATAITAGASGQVGTTGASSGASGGQKDATTTGSSYYKGMAVFTIVKGGAMVQAAVAGQKFTYKAVTSN
ncbi:MAG: lipid-binding SYLF domain-containing protein [Proteobacteria bacterium]|nr:lipid-binding SYLF domain-containing protein [Pseudomonadota bacterium]